MTQNLTYVKELSLNMQKYKFMLSYKGNVSQAIIKSLLTLAEKKLEIEDAEIATKKKVFNVMVECLQNISKHTEEQLSDKRSMVMLGKLDNQYIVYSGNLMLTKEITVLENKLLAINVMNKEELSEIYKRILTESPLGKNGMAGLGLIDIAKKSGNKLEFYFHKIDEQQSYFTLKTAINIH